MGFNFELQLINPDMLCFISSNQKESDLNKYLNTDIFFFVIFDN